MSSNDVPSMFLSLQPSSESKSSNKVEYSRDQLLALASPHRDVPKSYPSHLSMILKSSPPANANDTFYYPPAAPYSARGGRGSNRGGATGGSKKRRGGDGNSNKNSKKGKTNNNKKDSGAAVSYVDNDANDIDYEDTPPPTSVATEHKPMLIAANVPLAVQSPTPNKITPTLQAPATAPGVTSLGQRKRTLVASVNDDNDNKVSTDSFIGPATQLPSSSSSSSSRGDIKTNNNTNHISRTTAASSSSSVTPTPTMTAPVALPPVVRSAPFQTVTLHVHNLKVSISTLFGVMSLAFINLICIASIARSIDQ
jgi:hypothetical protein